MSFNGWFNILQAPSDVDKTPPTNGQCLVWDDTTLLWTPKFTTETIAHAGLTDMPDVAGTNSDHDARYTRKVMTNAGDMIYGGASGAATRLGIGGGNTVLHGGASVPAYSAVVEADITLTPGNTTNNTAVGTHGFAPSLSGLTTQFLRGDGAWAAPALVTVPYGYVSETFSYTASTAHSIVHNFGTFPVVQAFDTTFTMVIPQIVQNLDTNTVAITFSASAAYTLVLTVGSPPLTAYTTTSGDYSMLAGDYLIEETGTSKIVTLLTPVGRSGKTVVIKNSSSGVCNVQTAAGLIDGIADVTLATKDSLSVCSNGTNWLVI